MKFQNVYVREGLLFALWKRKILILIMIFKALLKGIQVPDS